jgi:hypothetical protein
MKYALFLLALIVGSVSGTVLVGVRVRGSTEVDVVSGDYVMADGIEATCDPCVMDNLYKRCVEDPAVARGAVVAARRGLRDDRRLCPSACTSGQYYTGVGSWCYTLHFDCLRRLTLAEEHSERVLVVLSELQDAALVCYQEKTVEFPCLGVAGDIAVEVSIVSV